MKYYCNPVNINYRYQFNADQRKNKISICREAADPSMISFKGKYFIFASMTLGVWVSDDLVHWENHKLSSELPLYDYAPDVRVMGEYVYFCASRRGENCDRYRTKDIINGPYEKIEGTFDYWDPNLFVDDDGRVYFYWGCSNETPIWGVELNPETMEPVGEKRELISGNPKKYGYERVGEDNSRLPKSEAEIEAAFQHFVKAQGTPIEQIPPQYVPLIKGMFTDKPYIEGAWMDKHQGKYYLQYAFAGTQYNTYGDGVYVSDSPLGPFVLAENNPYSYHPGGFMPGAGHGSTMEDLFGNIWHTATMRISVNHDFERRVGIWKAAYDEEGELCCNQRYGDWPIAVGDGKDDDIWANPEWMLLSYGKRVSASSYVEGKEPNLVCNENVQNWWQAKTNHTDEWLLMDLGKEMDVRGIQVNFADDEIMIPVPGEIRGTTQARYIEEAELKTQYLLEGSLDGEEFFVLEDKRESNSDLSHDFLVWEKGVKTRFVKISRMKVPYDQNPCISGLRVFGKCGGELPQQANYTIERISAIDMNVQILNPEISSTAEPVGYNILWGQDKDKLYHSYLTYEPVKRIGALVEGKSYFVRVDTFNQCGITEGKVQFVE